MRYLLILLLTGCGVVHDRSSEDIGLTVLQKCKGDCECVNEIRGKGVVEVKATTAEVGSSSKLPKVK